MTECLLVIKHGSRLPRALGQPLARSRAGAMGACCCRMSMYPSGGLGCSRMPAAGVAGRRRQDVEEAAASAPAARAPRRAAAAKQAAYVELSDDASDPGDADSDFELSE
jgi:hypothetical protein